MKDNQKDWKPSIHFNTFDPLSIHHTRPVVKQVDVLHVYISYIQYGIRISGIDKRFYRNSQTPTERRRVLYIPAHAKLLGGAEHMFVGGAGECVCACVALFVN